MKAPLVILTGPTSVGKTDLSIKLAKAINGEIISADSMQVYRKMDIGTAKISPEEMQGVRHHLIDILDPTEDFNVMEFAKRAKEACEDIVARGAVPIIAGGTGFYIQALLYGIDFTEKDDSNGLRERLQKEAEADIDAFYERLKSIDPAATEYIHKNNLCRVIRAVEFYELTGQRISEHNAEQREKESIYNSAYFVLNCEREKLYQRIDLRVDKMLENGLVDEVKSLVASGCSKDTLSMKALGYKEIIDYLDGITDYETAVNILKRDTRHFAKRQLTWFRREREVIWLERESFTDENAILDFMLEELKKRGIIQK